MFKFVHGKEIFSNTVGNLVEDQFHRGFDFTKKV